MLKALCDMQSCTDEINTMLANMNIEAHLNTGDMLKQIQKSNFNLIITEGDLNVIHTIKTLDPRAEIIFFGKKEAEAIEALRFGASAFYTVPLNLDSLRKSISMILEVFDKRRKIGELEGQLYSNYLFAGHVVSRNARMMEIFTFMRRIAPYYKTVLITGETGTGKDVIARALHQCSSPEEPLITCNCGGLNENLLSSELFGHKRGAFTGAQSDKKGLFDLAGRGTLFLDEIGEVPLSMQANFLRVLQDGQFRPVGSEKTHLSNCRVIAATNSDLQAQVKNGKYREDLYYRLSPLSIHLPALRERKEDIPLLARTFIDRFNNKADKEIKGISLPAQDMLVSYDWPGNVRELESVIEQAAIMSENTFIGTGDLPEKFRGHKTVMHTALNSLEDTVKSHIEFVLNLCRGNRSRAARELGISRRALLRKIEKYSIDI